MRRRTATVGAALMVAAGTALIGYADAQHTAVGLIDTGAVTGTSPSTGAVIPIAPMVVAPPGAHPVGAGPRWWAPGHAHQG